MITVQRFSSYVLYIAMYVFFKCLKTGEEAEDTNKCYARAGKKDIVRQLDMLFDPTEKDVIGTKSLNWKQGTFRPQIKHMFFEVRQ